MEPELRARLEVIRAEMESHLADGIIPFWSRRGVDHEYGGYLTCFDAHGRLNLADTDKYIVTQTRMIWGFSLFYHLYPGQEEYRVAARQGVDFFLRHFWDAERGGWFWKVRRDGLLIDSGKVVYGQSFAIYALAQYFLSTGDERGLEYAVRTFNLLQHYCADTARGGYYENLEPDWRLSEPGFCAGDRKSLDIHMHLLEAFTTLAQASGAEIHRRRLQEVMDVLLTRMIDMENGCGLNQFDLYFRPIPAIAIRRTWNAERKGDRVEQPTDTTSYGHNLELAWLLTRAADVLGQSRSQAADVVSRLTDHALRYGVDWERGGVYRDGPHAGPALVRDKEFWQNAEALVGLLNAYEVTGSARALEAFEKTWAFARQYLINEGLGEWRTLVSETGAVLVGDIGSPWKACYHTGRAVYESICRLDRLLEQENKASKTGAG